MAASEFRPILDLLDPSPCPLSGHVKDHEQSMQTNHCVMITKDFEMHILRSASEPHNHNQNIRSRMHFFPDKY